MVALLSLWQVRTIDGIAIVLGLIFALIVSEFAVFMNRSFMSLNDGVDKYGEQFIRDSLDLMNSKGDSAVYHLMLLTTYDGTCFKT